jgi:glyoxylase-like metal-dependent hydrolase (beta-lactamase superfamily II)
MEITPRVHSLHIPFTVPVAPGRSLPRFVNVFLLLGAQAWLIDTGVAGSGDAILNWLGKLGHSVEGLRHICLTHGHVDHMGSAKQLRDASGALVYAHAAERNWIEDIETQAEQRPIPGFRALAGSSVAIDRIVNDGDVFELDTDLHLHVLHTPGHSPGSLSFWLPEEGVVCTGDVIPVAGDMPVYDDPLASVQSIQRLMALSGVKVVLSSWDQARHGVYALQAMKQGIASIEHMHAVVQDCAAATDRVLPLEFSRLVLQELQLPAQMLNPLVMRTVMGHYQRRHQKLSQA